MLGVRLVAAFAGVLNLTLAVLYLPMLPEGLVRRPLAPGQVSAVVYIEQLGPIWTAVFTIAGVLLIRAAALQRGYVAGHLAAGIVWAGYGGAIVWSAVLTQPPVPITTGTIACFIACQHLAMARAATERGAR